MGYESLSSFFRKNAEKHGYIHFDNGETAVLQTYSYLNRGASEGEHGFHTDELGEDYFDKEKFRMLVFNRQTSISLYVAHK